MEWFRGRNLFAADRFEEMISMSGPATYSLCVSRINLGEIYYSTARDSTESAAVELLRRLEALSVEIVRVNVADIDAAARLKSRHRISYADCFAAVLSMNRGAPLVTGDPDFRTLESAGLLELHGLGT